MQSSAEAGVFAPEHDNFRTAAAGPVHLFRLRAGFSHIEKKRVRPRSEHRFLPSPRPPKPLGGWWGGVGGGGCFRILNISMGTGGATPHPRPLPAARCARGGRGEERTGAAEKESCIETQSYAIALRLRGGRRALPRNCAVKRGGWGKVYPRDQCVLRGAPPPQPSSAKSGRGSALPLPRHSN
jgi:hypothetical protein